jgi:hypothetical protein
MKSTLFLSAVLVPLSVFGLAEPKAEAEALPEPQNPLAGLIGAGILLGTLGAIGSTVLGAASGKCECATSRARCSGTKCECANEEAITCWVTRRGKCAVQISVSGSARKLRDADFQLRRKLGPDLRKRRNPS